MEMDKLVGRLNTSNCNSNDDNETTVNNSINDHDAVEYKPCIPILHLVHKQCCKSINNAIALLKLDVEKLSQKVMTKLKDGDVSGQECHQLSYKI